MTNTADPGGWQALQRDLGRYSIWVVQPAARDPYCPGIVRAAQAGALEGGSPGHVMGRVSRLRA
jgi:hypothetical protein